MGMDLAGPLRVLLLIVLLLVIFGPAIWLVNKTLEKSGADVNKDSTTIWSIVLGVSLMFLIALFGRSQGWWGE